MDAAAIFQQAMAMQAAAQAQFEAEERKAGELKFDKNLFCVNFSFCFVQVKYITCL